MRNLSGFKSFVLFNLFFFFVSLTYPEIESNNKIQINENSQKDDFYEEEGECENFVDHEILAKDLSINIIKKSEGFRNKSYICPAGKRSIGYGFRYIKKSNITKKESDSILSIRYNELSLELDKYIKNDSLNDYQKHALVSLTYNIGINNFKRSTLLKHINKNDLHLVDKEFLKWRYAKVKGKKKVLKGLKIRRKNELKLWNTLPRDIEKDYLST